LNTIFYQSCRSPGASQAQVSPVLSVSTGIQYTYLNFISTAVAIIQFLYMLHTRDPFETVNNNFLPCLLPSLHILTYLLTYLFTSMWQTDRLTYTLWQLIPTHS